MLKSTNKVNHIFDREFHKIQLKRAIKNFKTHSFLVDEVSDNVIARLNELNISASTVLIYGLWNDEVTIKGDITRGFLIDDWIKNSDQKVMIYDEEANPFKEPEFDWIISNLSLHFINDVLGALIQYRKILKDGRFIATFWGGKTLQELKEMFYLCDQELNLPSFPRVIPFVEIKDAASLMQKAGFNKVVSDSYEVTCRYENLISLFMDIKGFGQSNLLITRNKKPISKEYLMKLENLYKHRYDLNATFEIITVTGQVG